MVLWMVFGSAAIAGTAAEPCYGHSAENRISSDHFWVEWNDGVITPNRAPRLLEAAEAAREAYLGWGWSLTDEPIVVYLSSANGEGISGLTRTALCGGLPVPIIDLFVGSYDREDAAAVLTHEVAHAVQYADMGAYLDSVTSWLWWMEGTATWLTVRAVGDRDSYNWAASGYLVHPEFPLSWGVEGYIDPAAASHLYGTALLAETVDEQLGMEALRATWAWGAERSGEALRIDDAIAGIGGDFNSFWAQFLARVATKHFGEALAIEADPVAQFVIDQLPASVASVPLTAPRYFGMNLIRIEPSALRRGAVQLHFSGDSAVTWDLVVARADAEGLLDYVRVPVENGVGEGWIHDANDRTSWVVASPRGLGPSSTPGWAYTLDLERIRDPGPMDGRVVVREAPGGCEHSPTRHPLGISAMLALGWMRRRRA